VDTIGFVKSVMQKSEQELPVGYQAPNPYANHPQVIAWEKFIQTEASLPCTHYQSPLRGSRYSCALCHYEFYERDIKERINE
jgi:hypothetical protein